MVKPRLIIINTGIDPIEPMLDWDRDASSVTNEAGDVVGYVDSNDGLRVTVVLPHGTDCGADLGTIRDALIVLGGFLPFFAADPAKVERAKRVGVLRDEAFDALNRLAVALGEEPLKRQTDWRYK